MQSPLPQTSESRPLPPLGPNDVQISIRSTGLCGSDLHYYNHHRNGDILVREPLSLGHESSGVVTAVGSAVQAFQIGDRVALEAGVPCTECERCAEGRYNICSGLRFRGSGKAWPHFQGTLQERINHPARWCHRLPDNVSFDLGALLEPLGVAIHASRRAQLIPGSTVLVFGAGAVGLLCAAMSKVSKAKTVIIADIQAERVDFAVENGFAHAGFVVPRKQGTTTDEKLQHAKDLAALAGQTETATGLLGGVDMAFECTGVEACTQAAIYATRAGGKVMLVGMGSPIQTLPISAAALREVDLVGVFRYASTYAEAIELVASGNAMLPDLEKLVTHRFCGLDGVQQAFEMAGKTSDKHGNLVLKVVVEMGREKVNGCL
ncbi:MAG: sorbitol dehydrogenase [Lasallia pustulata]|uniref:Sorbitol dehydrogenase n=1 Tax=Lasallia pustulata TaxID=136370 RepID=A0A5M8PZJ3_9LECA|nr:MAG: sorbitol dehydrogenase [Lasallia pustulata]